MAKILESIFNNKENINEVVKKQSNTKNAEGYTDNFDDFEQNYGVFKIGVFGIGGAGCNMVAHMVKNRKWDDNVEIVAFNTDLAALRSLSGYNCHRFLLGKQLYRGAGSGGDPNVGQSAAENDRDQIHNFLKDKDIVFLLAGLGKGTGSGATPIFAQIAKELGVCVVSIVNLPSIQAEGQIVYEKALRSFKNITEFTNSYSTISNDRIIELDQEQNISLIEAFSRANEEVTNTIESIVNIINVPSEINVDFADVRNFFLNSKAFMFSSIEMLNDNYSKEKLISQVASSFKNSFCNLDIKNAKSVIANLDLCHNAHRKISADIKNSLVEISGNDKLWFVNGINSHEDDNKLKMNFLISSDQTEESCLNNSTNDKYLDSFINNKNNSDYMTDAQFNQNTKEMETLTDEKLKTINGILTRSIFEDDNGDDSFLKTTAHVTKHLSSDQCNDILTRAIDLDEKEQTNN